MAFPDTPLDLRTEIQLAGTWTDISPEPRLGQDVAITRGRSDEAAQVDRSLATMKLNNRDGKFSPRNPVGAYYGLIGKNTPLRMSLPTDSYLDLPGTAGAKASAPDAAALGITGDIDVRIDLTLSNWRQLWQICGKYKTTSNQRSWALQLGADGLLTFYWSTDGTLANRVTVTSTQTVPAQPGRLALRATLDVNNGASGNTATFYTSDSISGTWAQLGDPVVTSGTTSIFDSTSPIEVGEVPDFAGPTVNSLIHLHAFQALSGIAGTVVANPDFTAQAAGATSFADTASSPNTWTLAGDASIVDRRWRFHGEVSAWPQQWELTGQDAWVPIEASGILRRLGTGSDPLESAVRRGLTSQAATQPLEYWPCEDDSGATSLASALDGGRPMTITTGTPTLGSYEGFKGSKSLPLMANSAWTGLVRGYTATGVAQCRFLLSIGSSGAPSPSTVIGLQTSGTAAFWYLVYTSGSGGGLSLNAYDTGASLIFTSGADLGYNGVPARWSIELTQNGANIDWLFGRTRLDNPYSFLGNIGTLNSQTFGTITKVFVNVGAFIDDTMIGHISVHDEITDIFEVADEMSGFDGEPAARRIARLCGEERIAFQSIGGYGSLTNNIGGVLTAADDTSEPLGPQRPLSLLALLREAADADGGMLFEPREIFGLGYRTRQSLYSQTPRATIDYSAHELSDVPAPVDDDQLLANDIVVSRVDGSSARAVQTSGPNNVNRPEDDPDGVGRYPGGGQINVRTDEQLPHQAEWRRALGTTTDQRFPAIAVNLASHELVANPALAADLQDVEVGDLLAITGAMPHQAPDDVQQIVQGMRETPYSYTHGIVFNGSPADPYRVAVWDTDRYDTAGSELVVGVDSDDTALTVLTTSGPTWTTDAADLPFDIRMGGERLTVTALTSAAVDAFGRTVSNGWGSPDIGPAWTTAAGTAADFAVTGSVGTHTVTSAGAGRWSTLDTGSTDFDVYGSGATSALATGGSLHFYLLGRFADTSNMYIARAEFTTTQTVIFTLRKIVAGADTQLVTAGAITGLTHAAGTFFRMRFQGTGSTLTGKIWLASAAEPDAWNLTATDTALTGGTQAGFRSFRAAGNTNVNPVFSYDNFEVVNPQAFTVTRSVNDVSKSHSAGTELSLWQPARWAL